MEFPTHDKVTLTGPFIGLVLTAVLFGFTILQALQYCVRFPGDSLVTKCKVAFVCILDLLHFVFTISLVHTFFVSSCEARGLIKNIWSLKAMTITQTILTLSVHFIYLQRIHTLSNIPALTRASFSRIINVVIMFITFCATGAAAVFIYGVQNSEGITSSQITEDLRWAVFIGFGATVAIDIVITALTCFVLHMNRIEIGLEYISKRSNRLLLSLFTYSLATGLLTSIAAGLVIIIYLARPDTLDFMSICLVMSKLYTNSLLSLVQYVRRKINDDLTGSESRLPSVMVFRVSQHSRCTNTNLDVPGTKKASPSLISSDAEFMDAESGRSVGESA